MDDPILAFVKDFLWAPAIALVAWAWNRNQQEHDRLQAAHDKLQAQLSVSQSSLNDRIMEHVDTRFEDAKTDNGKRIDKVNSHIEKLFQNAEQDRKDFHAQIDLLRHDSFSRHLELMSAIHGKADK